MANKLVICDSTVFLRDYLAVSYGVENATAVIPFAVLETLRAARHRRGSDGRNAREFFSLFKKMKQQNRVSTRREDDPAVLIWRESRQAAREVGAVLPDEPGTSALIAAALEFRDMDEEVSLLTCSSIVYLTAESFSLDVSYFTPRKFRAEDLYAGCRSVQLPAEQVQDLRKRNSVSVVDSFIPNEYLRVSTPDGEEQAYCRYHSREKTLKPLDCASSRIPEWIVPRNGEQSFALDALLDDHISLVSLIGKAGTGKTLLALAVGLYKSLDKNIYDKVLVSRPTLPMGADIGYLPGSIEEKLGPWMHPIADNVDYLLRTRKVGRANLRSFTDLADMGLITAEPLSFIRGRSIHRQFLIVDEAQNLNLHEIKTILTRAGEGTKIVLAGDPYQIDNPELSSVTSGLMQVVERFRDKDVAAHITL
ncbi:MAG: PhoH family protein, partial [Fibrobacterota bacterium]